jgi:Rrf2 family protein
LDGAKSAIEKSAIENPSMARVSAKTEYACIAVFELAQRYGQGEPVRIRDIAHRHGVPSRFLVQILLQLKGAGLVASTRGASGGYQLARAPDELSLGEVMGVIEGPAESGLASAAPDSPAARVLSAAWSEASGAEQRLLAETSFADLVDRARRETEPMYYI